MFQQSLRAFITKHTFLLLFLLAISIAVFRSWEDTILFTDELDIEDAAYGMAHGESWIIPSVNGEPVLTKPPLVYWITAPMYTFLPITPLTRRIPMVVFGFMLTLLIYQSAKLYYGKTTAFWAVFLFITSAPFIYFTKAANFDLPNAFFSLLTLYLYNRGKSNHRFLYLASISLGLGILTRSFLALIPVFVVGIDYFLSKKRLPLFVIIVSCILTLLIVLPWHLLAFHLNSLTFIDHYLRFPLLYHATGRVLGDSVYTPLFYFFIFLLFPFTTLAILYFFSKIRSHLSSIDRQLFAYCIFIFLFLSFSSTRHEWYIFPIYPVLSILAGAYIASIIFTLQKHSIAFVLFLLFVFSIIISSPFLLLSSPLLQVESITALRVMESNSTPEDTLYLYRYPLITQTRFFPNSRRMEILPQVNEKTLKDKQKLFLLIRTQDTFELSAQIRQQVYYQTDDIALVELSSGKSK